MALFIFKAFQCSNVSATVRHQQGFVMLVKEHVRWTVIG